MAEKEDARGNDESLKLAVAISLLRSKILKNGNDSGALSPSQSNALLRWKRKVRHFFRFHSNLMPSNLQFYSPLDSQAKERKQEILKLREDVKNAQGSFSFLSRIHSRSLEITDSF